MYAQLQMSEVWWVLSYLQLGAGFISCICVIIYMKMVWLMYSTKSKMKSRNMIELGDLIIYFYTNFILTNIFKQIT